ncbi:NAD(P)/FAD-dependent oxidoreductase [Pseudonocardia halophobica]|uniref:NAD(P)/FAD-dependent oxidoreductase n=1 Tax=Pseudonocardia halophobica TaxID=29401 RepID=UPI003D8C49EB
MIVGAGHAGASAAIALRSEGYDGEIVLVGDEPHPPYNRPPLSKSYLKGGGDLETVAVRAPSYWADERIRLELGRAAVTVDAQARRLVLADDTVLPYRHLILATGARPRLIDADAPYEVLRTWDDAVAVRRRLHAGARVCIVGGGFIGLELACAAAAQGAAVTLVEAADRLLARALSIPMASTLREDHERNGVRVVLGRPTTAVSSDHVVLSGDERIDVDLTVVGIGVVPNDDLAARSGLKVSNGVAVDEYLATTVPDVSAIGDCAQFPCTVTGRIVRLESVQNGTDQARYVARKLVSGHTAPYSAVPWFWTEQYGRKVMIAGCSDPSDTAVVRGAPGAEGFSVCRVDSTGALTAVESLDAPRDHVAARRLLGSVPRFHPDLERLADPSVPLAETTGSPGPA